MTRRHVRYAERSHLPAILEIDQASSLFPWSEDQAIRIFRNKRVLSLVCEIVYTSELPFLSPIVRDVRLAGFVVYRSHEQIADAIEIIRLGVAPDLRRQGIGRALLLDLQRRIGRTTSGILIEVPEVHTIAHLFLKTMGYRAHGVIHGNLGDRYLFHYEGCDGTEKSCSLAPAARVFNPRPWTSVDPL
jgi:ribosomal protein S18 acetylase RimI-like enzyme